jgi:hypothetical protein
MEREPIKTDIDGLAEVWRIAEQRRAEDIGPWLGRFFEKSRRLKAPDVDAPYPEGHPVLR